MRTLAHHDDIAVAGPVLRRARLEEGDLLRIAETKSQAHLLALSARRGIGETLSDILVARGNREVSRALATNNDARLSELGFSTLVNRAQQDDVLAEKVAQRTDIPPRLFRQLLMQASEVVQKRLLAQAKPETQAEIRRILAKVTDEVAAKAAPRNYATALAAVRALHQAAQARRSRRRRIRQGRQIRGDHRGAGDALLGAGRSGRPADERRARRSGADPRARRRFQLADGARDHQRRGPRARPASQALETARENFERLTAATAQRVVRFWQVRQGTTSATRRSRSRRADLDAFVRKMK